MTDQHADLIKAAREHANSLRHVVGEIQNDRYIKATYDLLEKLADALETKTHALKQLGREFAQRDLDADQLAATLANVEKQAGWEAELRACLEQQKPHRFVAGSLLHPFCELCSQIEAEPHHQIVAARDDLQAKLDASETALGVEIAWRVELMTKLDASEARRHKLFDDGRYEMTPEQQYGPEIVAQNPAVMDAAKEHCPHGTADVWPCAECWGAALMMTRPLRQRNEELEAQLWEKTADCNHWIATAGEIQVELQAENESLLEECARLDFLHKQDHSLADQWQAQNEALRAVIGQLVDYIERGDLIDPHVYIEMMDTAREVLGK